MKKILILLVILFSLPWQVFASEESLADRLSGRILLQVESYGRSWYVDPVTKERYYLSGRYEALNLMRYKSLGITNKDLAKIPTAKNQQGDPKLVERLKGRLLLQVEEHGEVWYVNPVDGLRYYLRDGEAAFELMRKFGLGITNDDLAKIPMNREQIAHDTTFKDVAYVRYDGNLFFDSYNADTILPLASMTKIVTAMVLMDLKPDWDKIITITKEHLYYPKIYVGNDATSEVNLAVGDKMTFYDLWVAMLVASSNQGAAALVDSTGLTVTEFAELMNKKAESLGLKKTKFCDVAGLSADNITTPKEMAKLAYSAFSIPEIAKASQNRTYIIKATTIDGAPKEIKVVDRNYSLWNFGVESAKTGYLVEAQRTVATKKGNDIVVIMHALSMTQRNEILGRLFK